MCVCVLGTYIPFSPRGKEGIGVLSVELEGFSNIRQAHRAGGETAARVSGVATSEEKQNNRYYDCDDNNGK